MQLFWNKSCSLASKKASAMQLDRCLMNNKVMINHAKKISWLHPDASKGRFTCMCSYKCRPLQVKVI